MMGRFAAVAVVGALTLAGCSEPREAGPDSPVDAWILQTDSPEGTTFEIAHVVSRDDPFVIVNFWSGAWPEDGTDPNVGIRILDGQGNLKAEAQRAVSSSDGAIIMVRWDEPCPFRSASVDGPFSCRGVSQIVDLDTGITHRIARISTEGTAAIHGLDDIMAATGATRATNATLVQQTFIDGKAGATSRATWYTDSCGSVRGLVNQVLQVERIGLQCGSIDIHPADLGFDDIKVPAWTGPDPAGAFEVHRECSFRLVFFGVQGNELVREPSGSCAYADLFGDFVLPPGDVHFRLTWEERPAAVIRLKVGSHVVEGLDGPLDLTVPGVEVPPGTAIEIEADGATQGTRFIVEAAFIV